MMKVMVSLDSSANDPIHIPMGDIELDNVESFVDWMKNQRIEDGDGDYYHYEAHRFDTGPIEDQVRLFIYFEADS